jgi:subtilisin family serine protease
MKNGLRILLGVAILGPVLPLGASTGAWRLIPATAVHRSYTATELAQSFRNGRLLAKAKAGTEAGALRSAEAAIGASLERTFLQVPRLEVLTFAGGATVKAQIARLMATGLYEYVEPDRILHVDKVPNDPDFSSQWNMANTGQDGGTVGADIHAEAGWDISDSAPSTIVAVIDSGIRVTHEDLAANTWKNPSPGSDGCTAGVNGINATFPQTEPGNGDPNDDFFHGTMVAGIIGAVGNNALAVAGVAWNVQLMALKFITAPPAP